MHFLLSYEVVPDYVTRRAAHREEHLRLARAASGRGELVLGGAFDPPVGTALLFRGASPAAAEAFAEADPYVLNGLVTSWRVRRWTTVVGADAEVRVDDFGAPPRAAADATPARLTGFLRSARFWTVASVGHDGAPESAVVGVAVEDDLGLVFDSLDSSRKVQNLRRDPRVSLVMWCGAATAQIEGHAEILLGEPRSAAQREYLVTFPDGVERATLPATVYVRVRPSWLRVTDFAGDAPTIVELSEAALQPRLTRPRVEGSFPSTLSICFRSSHERGAYAQSSRHSTSRRSGGPRGLQRRRSAMAESASTRGMLLPCRRRVSPRPRSPPSTSARGTTRTSAR